MDITFKKKKKDLEGEVKVKSLDIEHIDEDFQPEIESCELKQKFITISPECVRCNLCVEECPVEAINPAESTKPAKILDECVKCEICAQTCPVKAVKVIESTSNIDEEVKYQIKDLKIPHRRLRMKEIKVDKDKCNSCNSCIKICPTEAIKLDKGWKAEIDKSLCIGCGACVNVCPEQAIILERDLGPLIKTKELLIDQEACVQCQVCEENCPIEAIKLEEDEVVINEDECILCDVCSTKCPVGALKLERVAHES
jgi:ferredoxin